MVSEQDKGWLSAAYPGLLPGSLGLNGTIAITAAFHKEDNLFFILGRADTAPDGAVVLSGEFHVSIEERTDKSISSLPALKVIEIEPIPDRHFSQKDFTACLCSPFEETDFLEPEFKLQAYIEQLVMPFLYGQLYYSLHKQWPWSEFAHGATGLLESYARSTNRPGILECIRQLRLDTIAWPHIKSALAQKPYIKGHISCFCRSGEPIRRCHPSALEGIRSLQHVIEAEKIKL